MIFGDDEPEDAWHPDDDLEDCIDNLRRRLALLDEPVNEWGHGTPAEQLDEIQRRLDARQRRPMTDRERVRAIDIIEDLYTCRERVRRGE